MCVVVAHPARSGSHHRETDHLYRHFLLLETKFLSSRGQDFLRAELADMEILKRAALKRNGALGQRNHRSGRAHEDYLHGDGLSVFVCYTPAKSRPGRSSWTHHAISGLGRSSPRMRFLGACRFPVADSLAHVLRRSIAKLINRKTGSIETALECLGHNSTAHMRA